MIKDTPTDLALNLNPLAIGLRSPLLALARNVRHARRSGRDGGREVQMDSLTFGVIMLLLAERLGLPSRLVQTNDEELILQAHPTPPPYASSSLCPLPTRCSSRCIRCVRMSRRSLSTWPSQERRAAGC